MTPRAEGATTCRAQWDLRRELREGVFDSTSGKPRRPKPRVEEIIDDSRDPKIIAGKMTMFPSSRRRTRRLLRKCPCEKNTPNPARLDAKIFSHIIDLRGSKAMRASGCCGVGGSDHDPCGSALLSGPSETGGFHGHHHLRKQPHD